MIEVIGIALFLALAAYAAYLDLTTYQIPNWISLAVVADFVVAAAIAVQDPVAIAWHLGAGLAMLVAGIGLFAANVLGGGDAKLLAASAVWFGWAGLFKFVIYVAILGGVLALFILGLRRAGLRESWTGRPWIQRLRAPDRGIPYGIAIAAAAGLMFVPIAGIAVTTAHTLH